MNSFIDDFGDKNPVKTYKCRVCGRRFPKNKMGLWAIALPTADKRSVKAAEKFNICKSCFEKDNSVVEQMVNELENLEI